MSWLRAYVLMRRGVGENAELEAVRAQVNVSTLLGVKPNSWPLCYHGSYLPYVLFTWHAEISECPGSWMSLPIVFLQHTFFKWMPTPSLIKDVHAQGLTLIR